jgi:iron(III) transport system ATP-binding protein
MGEANDMTVSIRNVSKSFGATPVLRGMSLDVEDGELFFLLGPSGCGKTTLLRLLAGFHAPDSGEIWMGGRRVDPVPPHERNIGMVFQNYALWPHLSVEENVAYGLDVRRVPAREKRDRVHEALAMVRMEALAQRSPNQLSGGQQQRVALARALVVRPGVLLLDEPLSNLDARLRLEMREEVRRLHAAFRITTVYVTHDQKESLALADRMAVLRDGVIEQVGHPREVYRRPRSRFVADFIGDCNWLEGDVASVDEGWASVRTALGDMTGACEGLAQGTRAWVGVRPEAVQAGRAATNSFRGVLARVNYLGEAEEHVIEAPATAVRRYVPNPRSAPEAGQEADFHVDPADLLLMARPQGESRA